jgi:hypothetical protein
LLFLIILKLFLSIEKKTSSFWNHIYNQVNSYSIYHRWTTLFFHKNSRNENHWAFIHLNLDQLGFGLMSSFSKGGYKLGLDPIRCNFLFDHLQVSYKQVNECKLIQMAWPHSPIEKNLTWDVMDYPFASKRTSPILCLT